MSSSTFNEAEDTLNEPSDSQTPAAKKSILRASSVFKEQPTEKKKVSFDGAAFSNLDLTHRVGEQPLTYEDLSIQRLYSLCRNMGEDFTPKMVADILNILAYACYRSCDDPLGKYETDLDFRLEESSKFDEFRKAQYLLPLTIFERANALIDSSEDSYSLQWYKKVHKFPLEVIHLALKERSANYPEAEEGHVLKKWKELKGTEVRVLRLKTLFEKNTETFGEAHSLQLFLMESLQKSISECIRNTKHRTHGAFPPVNLLVVMDRVKEDQKLQTLINSLPEANKQRCLTVVDSLFTEPPLAVHEVRKPGL